MKLNYIFLIRSGCLGLATGIMGYSANNLKGFIVFTLLFIAFFLKDIREDFNS
jgi:hypothetical protein